MDWQVVSALANVVLTITVVFAVVQLQQGALARNAQLLIWAVEQIDAVRKDVAILRQAPAFGSLSDVESPDFKSPWKPEEEAAADHAVTTLQRVSYLVDARLLSKRHIGKLWAGLIIEAWDLLEPWVRLKRLCNGEPLKMQDGPYTAVHFERLADYLRGHNKRFNLTR
jgi:hypothetical protein